jgi:hypothetical protein
VATQLIFGLTIFLVSYVGTTVLLIEILMWAMKRLDDRKASTKAQSWAVECQLASDLPVQTDPGLTCPLESYVTITTEAYQFDLPAKADCPQHSLACSV